MKICDHLRFNKFVFIEYTSFESVLITYRIYKKKEKTESYNTNIMLLKTEESPKNNINFLYICDKTKNYATYGLNINSIIYLC
ncbi:hypothetical protein BANORC5_03830 [Bacteroides nordii]|nr:hypothetical protein BANORC5_03830 [Bacteroides nordii]